MHLTTLINNTPSTAGIQIHAIVMYSSALKNQTSNTTAIFYKMQNVFFIKIRHYWVKYQNALCICTHVCTQQEKDPPWAVRVCWHLDRTLISL